MEVRTGTRVVHIDERSVRVQVGDAEQEIPARTVLWAAGVQASSFARAVATATGAETDRAGRIVVGRDLTIPGHPEIFAVGDDAVQPWKKGRPVPGVAQGAIQPRPVRRQGDPRPPRREARRALPLHGQGRRRGHRAARRGDEHRLARAVREAGRLHRLADVARHPHLLPDRVRQPDRRRRPLGVELLHRAAAARGSSRARRSCRRSRTPPRRQVHPRCRGRRRRRGRRERAEGAASAARDLDQARARGERSCGTAARHAELVEDVRDVDARRLLADEERRPDLAVRAAVDQECQDLALARAETVRVGRRGGAPGRRGDVVGRRERLLRQDEPAAPRERRRRPAAAARRRPSAPRPAQPATPPRLAADRPVRPGPPPPRGSGSTPPGVFRRPRATATRQPPTRPGRGLPRTGSPRPSPTRTSPGPGR